MTTLVHYAFPFIAVLYLVLSLRSHNPIRRRTYRRTGIIFAIVSLVVWWFSTPGRL